MWFVNFLIAIALNVIAYLILPQPKLAKPEAAEDWEDPVADAGKPIPVIFGTMTIKGVNNLGFWDKETVEEEKSSGKK